MGRKVIIILLVLGVCLWGLPSWADDDALFEMDDWSASFTAGWYAALYDPTVDWQRLAHGFAYGGGIHYAACSGGAMTQEATFDSASQIGINPDIDGTYHVYVRWVSSYDRPTNAHYRIYDGASLRAA